MSWAHSWQRGARCDPRQTSGLPRIFTILLACPGSLADSDRFLRNIVVRVATSPGMAQLLHPVIHLTPGTDLPAEDILRALAMSQAVAVGDKRGKYFKALGGVVNPDHFFFEGYCSSVSKDPKEVMFAVCRATDNTIFVAFRSTKDFSDVACDLQVCFDQLNQPDSSFHRGFAARCNDFFGGSDSKLLDEILHKYQAVSPEQPLRIILCGHSLGGAVAQIVLARWLKDNKEKLNHVHPLSMIAITFGAPHVCNSATADSINGNLQGKQRIISFVNKTDPISRILHQQPTQQGYNPIGLLVFLDQQDGGPRVRQVESTNQGETNRLLRRDLFQIYKTVTENELQHHKLASYTDSLVRTGVIDPPQPSRHLDRARFSTPPGKPIVQSVIFLGLQTDGTYRFRIQGENLLHRREVDMSWNGVKIREVIRTSDNEIMLSTREPCKERAKGKVDVVYITYKTHFGECNKVFESSNHKMVRRLGEFAKGTTETAVVALVVVAAVILL